MSEQELSRLLRMLLDKSMKPVDRANAARCLGEWDTQAVLDALLQVAQENDADESISRATGESIAEILIRRGEVDRVPLHDFTGDAYLGYDGTVARRHRIGDQKAFRK